MKVKKLQIFWNIMSSKGCKWSSLNAPGKENPPTDALLGFGIHSTHAAKIKRRVSEAKGFVKVVQ